MTLRERVPAIRSAAWPTLLAVAASMSISCDAKVVSPTTSSSTPDTTLPISSTVATGALVDTVDVNSSLIVTVTATDNKAIKRLDVVIMADLVQINLDSTVLATGQTTFAKTLTTKMVGVAAGAKIRVISKATDASSNVGKIDTLLLQAKDSVRPTIKLNAPLPGQAFLPLDTVKVDVDAADSSGLKRVYYSIYRVNSPIDTALVKTDSVLPSAVSPKAAQRTVFPFIYSVAVLSGTYIVRSKAVDVSGNVTSVPQVAILLKDPTPPGLVVPLPGRDTTVTANDTNFIVTMHGSDNISLVRMKAWGTSVKGDPAFGRVDTVLRYDTAFAPVGGGLSSLRAGLLDTVVSRRLHPVGQGLVPVETVTVYVQATDQSDNRTTVTRRVILVPNAFTQDSIKPRIDTIVPGNLATITLGSNFTVSARLRDNFGLARFTVVGISTKGDPNLGPVDTTVRYDTVTAPVKTGGPQTFRLGLTDTTITRIMSPTGPIGGQDTLRLIFRITDNSGRDSIVVRKVILLSGPTVTLGAPITGSTTFPGTRIPIQVSATGPANLVELGYRINNTKWNPPVKRFDVSSPASHTAAIVDTVLVPDTVVSGSNILVVPFARDVVNPGITVFGDSAYVVVNVPASDVTGPLVHQTIPTRVETLDSLVARAADPSGVRKIVYVLMDDSLAIVIQKDSVVFASPGLPKDTAIHAKVTIPLASLGHKYRFFSYAYDSLNNRANSVPLASIQPDSIRADTLRGVLSFGRTFRNPALPAGTLAGDLIVDRGGNAYISNIARNQLEFWKLADSTFKAPIFVGSQPWGMTFNRSGDSVFVANSGGTNISVVDTLLKKEERRIKTPANVLYSITQTIDPTSGVTRLTLNKIIQYSDRPQYIAMSKNGNLYYSTRPTSTATPGTIRRVDPRQPAASTEVQQVTTYATLGPANTFIIANVDSLFITKSLKDSISDNITIFERQYGTSTQITIPVVTALGAYGVGATDSNVVRLCNSTLRAASGDCRALQIDDASLSLTDTTFLAAGGNGNSVAFAEGHVSGRAARVMLVIDTLGSWFNVVGSAGISVTDLTNNASDQVFGLAVDSVSGQVLANGNSAFYADINASALFNLRLQGSFQTTLPGNGVAYHPKNVPGGLTKNRVTFVMQGDTSIAVVDNFTFRQWKVIPVRTALYGPMRAVLPTPAELVIDPALSVKLFCLTKEGMLVIPIHTGDLPP